MKFLTHLSNLVARSDRNGKRRDFGRLWECGFVDLGYIGLPFTWDNRQQGGQNIIVRLDRGFATNAFFQLFQEVKLWHVQTTESDHCAIVIDCQEVR